MWLLTGCVRPISTIPTGSELHSSRASRVRQLSIVIVSTVWRVGRRLKVFVRCFFECHRLGQVKATISPWQKRPGRDLLKKTGATSRSPRSDKLSARWISFGERPWTHAIRRSVHCFRVRSGSTAFPRGRCRGVDAGVRRWQSRHLVRHIASHRRGCVFLVSGRHVFTTYAHPVWVFAQVEVLASGGVRLQALQVFL